MGVATREPPSVSFLLGVVGVSDPTEDKQTYFVFNQVSFIC